MDKLHTYLYSLNKHDRANFAARCGTTYGYLQKAISKRQKFDVALCVNIERESGRAVTCEDLRPDADWFFIRNSS